MCPDSGRRPTRKTDWCEMMSPWKPKEPEGVDESARNHVLRVQSNELWIGWTADGEVEFSEGYDPLPETRRLLSLLGPVIKQNVKREAPKPKPRRSRWNKKVERDILGEDEDDI